MKNLFKSTMLMVSSIASLAVAEEAHSCTYNPSFGYIAAGISLTRSFSAEQDITGLFTELDYNIGSCGSIKFGFSALTSISLTESFDYGSLKRFSTSSFSIEVYTLQGLYVRSFFVEGNIGKKYCLMGNDYRSHSNCKCNHFDIALSTIFVYDEFSPYIDYIRGWSYSSSKDIAIGIKSSIDWSTESRYFTIAPSLGFYAQAWSSSKIEAFGNSLSDKTVKNVKRRNYNPIITASAPLLISISKGVSLTINPSIIWTMRSVKNIEEMQYMEDMMIENRVTGYLGIGLSSSRR